MTDTGDAGGQQGGQGDPGQGQGQPPADPKSGNDPKPGDDDSHKRKESADELRLALDSERKAHRETAARLTKLEKDHMSEQEKAIAEAKKTGHDEAVMAAGKRLAAAEFRAAAAGKIANPSAVSDMVDLSKYVGDDGEPDTRAIAAFVEKLVEGLGAPPANGRVPAGARGPTEPGNQDGWLRDAITGR